MTDGDDGVDGTETLQNVTQYDRYEYTVETGTETATSAFFLSHEQPFYRLERIGHETGRETVTVAANFTNVSVQAPPDGTHELTFDLEGESEDGAIDIDRQRSIEVHAEAWNRSTFTIDINRSRLPYGTYTYTVDLSADNHAATCSYNPDACVRTGTFTLTETNDSAGISSIDEVRVEEPSNVSVNVLGTEVTGERWEWTWSDGWVKQRWLAPVTATAVVGDERIRFSPDGPHSVDDPHEGDVEADNLNTVGTGDEVWSYDTTLEEGSVTIEATQWNCDDYDRVSVDQYNGTTYHNYECTDFGDPHAQVTVSDGGGDSDQGFLMTRDNERNDLPDIEKSYPRQRTVSQVFATGTDDIELRDDELTLATTDFAFMMETTMTQSGIQSQFDEYDWESVDTDNQTAMNLAAWDIAQHERDDDQGDPDFNDVIGLVQVDAGDEYASLQDPLSDPTVDGERREIGGDDGDAARVDLDDGGDSITVRVDEIVLE